MREYEGRTSKAKKEDKVLLVKGWGLAVRRWFWNDVEQPYI